MASVTNSYIRSYLLAGWSKSVQCNPSCEHFVMTIFSGETILILQRAKCAKGKKSVLLAKQISEMRRNDAFTRYPRLKMSIPEFSVHELVTVVWTDAWRILCRSPAAHKINIIMNNSLRLDMSCRLGSCSYLFQSMFQLLHSIAHSVAAHVNMT